jgi:hypothetical protein
MVVGIFAPEKGVNVSERTTRAFPAKCLFLGLKIPGGRLLRNNFAYFTVPIIGETTKE